MNITLIRNEGDLHKLSQYVDRLKSQTQPIVGIDTETNFIHDFWFRRVRTLQIGDKSEQYVIDLLGFAGSEERLIASQGNYGANNGTVYARLFEILDPVLCTNKFLKVGQNLSFEYEVLNWNFGRRIWNLYSTDLAERVIRAGEISLKKYYEFSMEAIVARYFNLQIDKSMQETFDLCSLLTEQQIEYAAFDVRMPLSMRQAQMKILNAEHLLTTVQIENDAIGTYVDMHLVGQNLNDERWMKRVANVEKQRIEEVKILDEGFIPVVGKKSEAVDYSELERLEKVWKNNFNDATPKELDKASEIRLEKNPEKKNVLKLELLLLKNERTVAKAAARAEFYKARKEASKKEGIIEKCEGEAFLNYGSNSQLLEALKNFSGMSGLTSVADDQLLKFNDRPLIQVLRKYRKGKKETGTYGESWVKRWITKPLAKEGWRHPGDGRLHCRFNQLEAETGRSSSEKPNAQNLPKLDEVRACFICDPPTDGEENCLVTIDMSGAELRIIAELAQARTWILAFAKGQDVHSVSTEILYPEKWPALALSDCAYYKRSPEGELLRKKCKCPEHIKLRDGTKAINFLLCYGGGPAALADELGVTLQVAEELMALHRKKFPDVWGYLEKSGRLAQSEKEARDMFGRRRKFPTPTYELAREWVITYDDDKLELNEEIADRNLFNFRTMEGRAPNEEEKWKLTHRSPTDAEIKQGMRAMFSSIGRRGKNHCIQGTNASIIKRAMGAGFDKNGIGYLWHTLSQFKARVQSMIHDELVVHCPKKYGEAVANLVGDAFKRAAAEVMRNVTMEFDYHVADRWLK